MSESKKKRKLSSGGAGAGASKRKPKKDRPLPGSKVCTANELRACRMRDGKKQFLINWAGEDELHNTWEPEVHIIDKDMIKTMEDKKDWKWEYYVQEPVNGKSVGWYAMDPADSKKLDEHYVKWLDGSDMASFQTPLGTKYQYVVDFDKMTQTNATHKNKTVRILRRV
jgi:hypothetical protein